ncbi:MAG: hypothetical protein AB7O66_03460 [Limisphaerales bacterium]
MNTFVHPWLLTGPWYRWGDYENPGSGDPYNGLIGRLAPPVFQKYDTSDLVNAFLKDPQRSLKFIEPDDRVRRITTGTGGHRYGLTTTGVRKLYLDTHKRFYLVVCELHCDLPGLPNASREDVCEAGFVVRRRVARIPEGGAAITRKQLGAVTRLRAQLAEFEELPVGMKADATLGLRARVVAEYREAQSRLKATAQEFGIRFALEGWVPDAFEGMGSWEEVETHPQTVCEHVYPLYPLIADPTKPDHSGGGRTLYFGLMPTGSADVDAEGDPRYDDRSLYHVRCFVRRHNPKCPKRRERPDCHGEIVWSLPTEHYQLANPFDLSGTSNRPINILLPDLPALEAQVATLQPGQGAPVRMIAPEGSNLEVNVPDGDLGAISKGGPPGAAICSFSIPLITIVASFVFRLFLPIVMLLFGLWFMLKIKFCILPSIDLSADAGLALELEGALGLDVDVSLDVALVGRLGAVVEPTSGLTFGELRDQNGAAYEGRPLAEMIAAQATDFSESLPPDLDVGTPPAEGIRRQLPSATTGLEYEARIEVKS